jgi:hypothetical protein
LIRSRLTGPSAPAKIIRAIALALMATIVLCAGGAGFGQQALADTPAAPSVTIVSPTDGGSASGTVTFTVAIDQPDATHPVTDVYLEIYGATQGHVAQDIDIPAGDCAPTCQESATFDTSTLGVPTNPDPSQYLPDLSDGVAEFAATVGTSFGPTGFAQAEVDLVNHRPAFTLPDLPIDTSGSRPTWDGTSILRTHALPTPDASTQAAVTNYRLMVPHAAAPTTDISAPAPATTDDTVGFNVRGLAPNLYYGYLAATDATGVSSSLIGVLIRVGVPYTLKVTVNSAYADQARITVSPTWLDGSTTAAQSRITSASATVSGAVVGQVTNPQDVHGAFTMTLTPPAGTDFPVHEEPNVTVTATDNYGVTQSGVGWGLVRDPISATWDNTAAVAGDPFAVRVVANDHSTSPVDAATITADGTALASTTTDPNGVATVASTPTTFTAGTHTLTLTVTLQDGHVSTAQHALTALQPVTVSLSAPATVAWANSIPFRANAIAGNGADAGAPVVLQSRRAGATAWTTAARGTTTANGSVTFSAPCSPTGNADWRVTTSATATRAAATSTGQHVAVTAQYLNLPTSSSVRRGAAYHSAAVIAPYQKGLRVAFQYRRVGAAPWITLNHAPVTQHGQVAIATTFQRTGRYQMRILRPATTAVTTTPSQTWTIRVY